MSKETSFLKTIFKLLVLAGLVWALFNHQFLIDEARLLGYEPPKDIRSIADRTTMTDHGRRLFYLNRPELEGKKEFRDDCGSKEQSIVLGCYINNRGIFILRVTDDRLQGIHEVTAAHEMLHAAYDRLSSSEKKKIDKLTNKEFSSLSNQRIQDAVKRYRNEDSSVVPNELHSILATEVRDISGELEEYYKKYFKDRIRVVEFSENYQEEFTSRQNKAASILQQMEDIQTEINRLDGILSARQSELEAEFRALESQRSSSDAESFNRQVREYNAKVEDFNATLNHRNSLANQYNELRKQYNSLIFEERELIEAIDANTETI